MKKIKAMTFQNLIFAIIIFLASFPVMAQIPQGIPNDPNALNIETTEEKLLYLILPLLVLAFLTYWYYKKSKRKGGEESKKE